MIPARPVGPNVPTSDTAYPGMAELREHAGPRKFMFIDFGWMEDVLAAWKGVAVFGGLLFLEGWLYWLGAVGYGGFTQAALIAGAAALFFGCAIVAFLGYAESALAAFAALVLLLILFLADPPAPISGASALFTYSFDVLPDQVTILVLWIFGALLAGLGTVFAVETYLDIDSDG